jgi:hypothetical protein
MVMIWEALEFVPGQIAEPKAFIVTVTVPVVMSAAPGV